MPRGRRSITSRFTTSNNNVRQGASLRMPLLIPEQFANHTIFRCAIDPCHAAGDRKACPLIRLSLTVSNAAPRCVMTFVKVDDPLLSKQNESSLLPNRGYMRVSESTEVCKRCGMPGPHLWP